MTHTYATVADFKAWLTDNASGVASGLDDEILSLLEGASRRVDAYVDRSNFGSGFGPRIASNRYEGDTFGDLDLRDDFLAATITIYDPPTESVATYTLAETTDFYLKPYNGPPYTVAELHGYGTLSAFPDGSRILVAGTAGYQSTTSSLGTAGTASSSATTLSTNGTPSAGMTLLIGSEHLYVTATSGGTVTGLRAQNGTTAAVIAEGAAVSYFTYPAAVKAATLAVAQRRWRSRDAGLTGDLGIPSITGTVSPRDTEVSILRTHVGHLKRFSAR